MAEQQEDVFVQKITLIQKGQPNGEFDLSYLKEITYIETIDLSGPKMILLIDDPFRVIRDEKQVKERNVLEVVLSDRYMRDNMDKTIQFTILTMPIDGSVITFNCLQEVVCSLKTPSKETILFTEKPVATILQKLAPGVKTDIATLPVLNSYHLLPGMRPSKLLRQMAKEYGVMLFWRRGKIVCKKLKEMLKAEAKITYYHNDNDQKENRIISYTRSNAKSVISDKSVRNFMGWDMVKGVVKSSKALKSAAELVSVSNVPSMDGQLEVPKPAIDIMVLGNGALVPGITLALVWNGDRVDMPIDESLPAKVVISTVAHRYSSQSYHCRVLGVLP